MSDLQKALAELYSAVTDIISAYSGAEAIEAVQLYHKKRDKINNILAGMESCKYLK